jgi:hypothetical protein
MLFSDSGALTAFVVVVVVYFGLGVVCAVKGLDMLDVVSIFLLSESSRFKGT